MADVVVMAVDGGPQARREKGEIREHHQGRRLAAPKYSEMSRSLTPPRRT